MFLFALVIPLSIPYLRHHSSSLQCATTIRFVSLRRPLQLNRAATRRRTRPHTGPTLPCMKPTRAPQPNTLVQFFHLPTLMGDNSGADSFSFTKVPLIPWEKLTWKTNYNIWAEAGSVKLWLHNQDLNQTRQRYSHCTSHKMEAIRWIPMHHAMVFNNTLSPSALPSF